MTAIRCVAGNATDPLHERIKDMARRLYPRTIRDLIGS